MEKLQLGLGYDNKRPQQSTPLSFQGLPTELRQQIWTNVLQSHSTSWSDENEIDGHMLCGLLADPLLGGEALDVCRLMLKRCQTHCRSPRLLVQTPDEMRKVSRALCDRFGPLQVADLTWNLALIFAFPSSFSSRPMDFASFSSNPDNNLPEHYCSLFPDMKIRHMDVFNPKTAGPHWNPGEGLRILCKRVQLYYHQHRGERVLSLHGTTSSGRTSINIEGVHCVLWVEMEMTFGRPWTMRSIQVLPPDPGPTFWEGMRAEWEKAMTGWYSY